MVYFPFIYQMNNLITEFEDKMQRNNFNFTRDAPANTISAAEETLKILLPNYYFLNTNRALTENQYRAEFVNTIFFIVYLLL